MCNELEQAVIYNSNVGKTIVEKTAYSLIKLAFAVNKSLIDSQKLAIGEEKSAIEQQRYNGALKANILKEYDEIEKKRIFQSQSQ